jgi:drug/metabolite transporter (DMT)-like permease
MNWLLLSLAAVTFWSISAVLGKFMRVHHTKSWISFLFMGMPAAPFVLFLLILSPFKIGSQIDFIISIATGILAFIGYSMYVYAVRKEEVTKVITLYGLGPIILLILGIIFSRKFPTAEEEGRLGNKD